MKAVSGRDLCRILERHGWTLKSVRGSHHKYQRGAARVTVPVHGNRTLREGTQRALMRDAGLAEDDL
ncbi:MAG TPA: type II toxin-antitoxin system HicA family toxin [Thermomicrobiales bacterium]|nr:type II toxin-antitoxin system HicA family toxin [Thermomicrobiales bacterium]